MSQTMELVKHYNTFFKISRANTPELLNRAFKLRYEVFIKDCGYKLGDYDEQQGTEHDSFDNQAEHCILIHRPTNMVIGYIRLIPFKNVLTGKLPIEDYGKDYFDPGLIKLQQLRTNLTGELSRLSIHPNFRRRLADQQHQLYSVNSENNKRYPVNYLPMCLILASLAMVIENDMEYTVALMEKQLADLLGKFGVVHKLIGRPIDYYGIRSPYMIFRHDTYNNLSFQYLELFKVIQQELEFSNTLSVNVQEAQS